jgi:hypothetical protein
VNLIDIALTKRRRPLPHVDQKTADDVATQKAYFAQKQQAVSDARDLGLRRDWARLTLAEVTALIDKELAK